MDRKEAINALSDGHGLWTIKHATEVLEALDILGGVPGAYIITWESQETANPGHDPKGIQLYDDKPGQGVGSLALGYYVVEKLGLKSNAGAYFGRGRQADANAQAIAVYFNKKEADEREENGGFTRREIHDAEVSNDAGS